MKPTPAELRAEIAGGPLAGELRPLWAALVRAGAKAGRPVEYIDADRADALLKALAAPGTRTRQVPAPMVLSEFTAAVGQARRDALISHARFPDLRASLLAQDHEAVGEWVTLFRQAAVISAADLTALTTYVRRAIAVPCSRLDELGWSVTYEDVRHAKREELGWAGRSRRG